MNEKHTEILFWHLKCIARLKVLGNNNNNSKNSNQQNNKNAFWKLEEN